MNTPFLSKDSIGRQLDRIESKIDALLAALAEDHEPEESVIDLSGNEWPDRDQSQPL